MSLVVDDVPKAKIFRERIGNTEYELQEEKLDVFDDVALWDGNPRLLPYLAEATGVQSEAELENHLRQTKGYDTLAKSIADMGQMEPIYAWKREDQSKYLVIEGATRVTILREQARKHAGKPKELTYRRVKANRGAAGVDADSIRCIEERDRRALVGPVHRSPICLRDSRRQRRSETGDERQRPCQLYGKKRLVGQSVEGRLPVCQKIRRTH